MRRLAHTRVLATAAVVVAALLIPAVAAAEPGFSAMHSMPQIIGANLHQLNLYGAVSCPTTSSCTAVGPGSLFSFGLIQHVGAPTVVTETNGTWGSRAALPIPGGGQRASVNGIVCASVGNCVAVGGYTDVFSQFALPLIETETSGAWAESTISIPKGSSGNGQLLDIWCASPGNCVALGEYSYSTSSSVAPLPMIAAETAGTWAQAVGLSDGGGRSVIIPTSLSCSDVADCTAVAYGSSTALGAGSFYWRETAGTWSNVALLPQQRGFQFLSYSVACPSATTCMAVGGLSKGAGGFFPSVATETSGSWSVPTPLALPKLAPVPDQALFTSVTCAGSSLCEAVGTLRSTSATTPDAPFAATWQNGIWSSLGTFHRSMVGARPAAQALFNAVACPSTAQCLALGVGQLTSEPGSRSSAFSTMLAPAREKTVPSPPLAVRVRPATHYVDVAWMPPGNDGGSPVTSFTAAVVPGGAHCRTARYACRIGGLIAGHRYRVVLRDSTKIGTSPPRLSASFVAARASIAPRRAR